MWEVWGKGCGRSKGCGRGGARDVGGVGQGVWEG